MEVKSSDDLGYFYSDMNEIMSYTQLPNGWDEEAYLYACGYAYSNPFENDKRYASMFRLSTKGAIEFDYLYWWGDRDEDSETDDICKSITYNEYFDELVLLLEVTSEELRPEYRSDNR